MGSHFLFLLTFEDASPGYGFSFLILFFLFNCLLAGTGIAEMMAPWILKQVPTRYLLLLAKDPCELFITAILLARQMLRLEETHKKIWLQDLKVRIHPIRPQSEGEHKLLLIFYGHFSVISCKQACSAPGSDC